MAAITLPNEWQAREYQTPLFEYMLSGGTMDKKRADCVWHRRAGKDSCSLQLAAVATQMRVGTYWHMLPSLQQGRRVIWDGIDRDGRRMIDQAFPKQLRKSMNNSEMKIQMKNGSVWQVVGSDNYDSLVGTNPVGIIMSEYSIGDPSSFEYFRPILLENDGFAVFIYTPRGKTHGFTLHNMASNNPGWFSQVLTVDDTKIMSREDVENEILAGMSREKAMQEFYCSFDIGMEGAYYTEEIAYARANGRVGDFPWDPDKPVHTWWDIGYRDNTSVLYTQVNDAGNPRIIDHDTRRNIGLPDWVKILRTKPYDYSAHYPPHDIDHHEWGTGQTRTERADRLQFTFEDAVEDIGLANGIDACRAMIRRAEFNEPLVGGFLDNLGYYHREYNNRTGIFKDTPNHDHSSHDADVMRYLSVGWQETKTGRILTQDADGHYRPNIRVKRACGPNRQVQFQRGQQNGW